MYEMCPVYKGMLDPIIISYKLTTIVSVTYYRIQQYPVKSIYNNCSFQDIVRQVKMAPFSESILATTGLPSYNVRVNN